MKKIFIAFAGALVFSANVYAQKKSAAIQYETSIDPVAMAEASGRQIPEEMKARMPKSIKANYELLYNVIGASYMAVEETEDSNSGGRMGGGPGRMMMRFGGFGGGNKEYYYTFADKKVVEASTLQDTTYIVPTELKVAINIPEVRNNPNQGPSNANIKEVSAVEFLPGPPTVEIIKSDETKKILNLNCKKVVVKSTRKAKVLGMDKDITDETTLWYTNDLGFDFSPEPTLWTEGTVLAIEKRGGGVTATSIDYRGVSNKDVTAPKKAIALTAEQFKAKQEAMMSRMRNNNRGQGGQGGVSRMIIN